MSAAARYFCALACLTVVVSSLGCSFGGGSLNVTKGAYSVTLSAESRRLPRVLRGGDIRVFTSRGNGSTAWLSRDAGTLRQLGAPSATRGSDALGDFEGIEIAWSVAAAEQQQQQQQQQQQPQQDEQEQELLVTAFRCYGDALVFEQRFPNGLNGTPGIGRDIDTPSSSFPSFVTTSWARTGVRLVTFAGQNAAQSTRYGAWPSAYAGGYLGGPLALVSTDGSSSSSSTRARGELHAHVGNVDGVALLSPLTRPMLQIHALDVDEAAPELRFGLQGLLHTLPSGFSIETVLVLSPSRADGGGGSGRNRAGVGQHAGAISTAFIEWGDIMLRRAGGQRAAPTATPWIHQLGYSTTGAYHYNPCDCPANPSGEACVVPNGTKQAPNPNPHLPPNCTTYEQTLLAAHADAQARGLPYRWFLIDSYWHAYDNPPSAHFEDVPAQVGSVFPHSLRWLRDKTTMDFGAHWSSSFSQWSPHAADDPEHWVCGAEADERTPRARLVGKLDEVERPRQCVPTSPAVFDGIFASDAEWGLRTIKVDHMLNLLVGGAAGALDCETHHCTSEGEVSCACDPGERNRTLARDALLPAVSRPDVAEGFINGLGTAAAANGVSIMWCMSFPNVLMTSVGLAAMTHARGSDDSHPPRRPFWNGNSSGYNGMNWHGFGGESTLLWALGLWPFKDTFYSNSTARVHNVHAEDYGWTEPMPFTHALVAALSGGGVAPGDPVGAADVPLILMTARADGELLKPTVPATYIDRVWQGDAAAGETSAASTVLQGHVWKFVSVIRNGATSLLPRDIGLVAGAGGGQAHYVIHEFCSYRPLARPCSLPDMLPRVQTFSASSSLELPAARWSDTDGAEARLLVASPVFPNGLALLGEEHKLVPVSTTRFVSVTASSGTNGTASARLEVEVRGAAGEVVSVLAAHTSPHGGGGGGGGKGSSTVLVTRTVCRLGGGGHARMVLAGLQQGEQQCHTDGAGT